MTNMEAIGTISVTADGKGVWAKKLKPLPKPVSLAPATVDDGFEVDPNSMQHILFSELLPPQDDTKNTRLTIGSTTQSPSPKTAPVARRASLFGGAMRVKAPIDASKKSSLQTPGRVLAKSRVPLSSSKQTPGSRSCAKSRLPDSISAEFNDCPDFLLAATQPRSTSNLQTPSKGLASSGYKTPGKVLTARDPNINSENVEPQDVPSKGERQSIEIALPPSAARTPGTKLTQPAKTENAATHFVFQHVEMPQPTPKKQEQKMSIFDDEVPVGKLASSQSASKIELDVVQPTPQLKSAVSLPMTRASFTKVEVPKKLDPAALPFPPTPKATVSATSQPLPPKASTSEVEEAPGGVKTTSLFQNEAPIPASNGTPALTLPEQPLLPAAINIPTASTPSASQEQAAEFGHKLRALASERLALLERLRKIQDEEASLLNEYFSKLTFGAQ